ncbi:glyoxal reductase-like [Amphiura filiformis]|uniref:glyoxal reductase-like n=1 Tax=Amphiura filiformis TaxID=82378 RepID=UPI003B2180E5
MPTFVFVLVKADFAMNRAIFKLCSGYDMPLFGLGTCQIKESDIIYKVIDEALRLGYRLIDTASSYRNEQHIGNALKDLLPKHGLKRSDIFITSKLAPKEQGTEPAYAACMQSLQRLQTDYLDLYLIHWPGKQKLKPDDCGNAEARRQSWLSCERLHKEGKVRSIGVSNYTVKHLDEMLGYATTCPAVLQVEYHPYLVQKDLLSWCNLHNTHLQAYSSLGRTHLLSDKDVIDVAKRLERKPSQVLLRWGLQQNIGVIPKTQNLERVAENAALWDFELTTKDMERLSQLHRNTKFCWDPSGIA